MNERAEPHRRPPTVTAPVPDPAPAPQALPEVSIHRGGGPVRCAYCHSAVSPDEKAACSACLAVHHSECWDTDHRCAACRNERPLVLENAPRRAPAGARRDPAAISEIRVRPRLCGLCAVPVAPGNRMVCNCCMAVHHPGCWQLQGRCALCEQSYALVPASGLDLASLRRRRPPPGWQLLLMLLPLGVLAIGGGFGLLWLLLALNSHPSLPLALGVPLVAVVEVGLCLAAARIASDPGD